MSNGVCRLRGRIGEKVLEERLGRAEVRDGRKFPADHRQFLLAPFPARTVFREERRIAFVRAGRVRPNRGRLAFEQRQRVFAVLFKKEKQSFPDGRAVHREAEEMRGAEAALLELKLSAEIFVGVDDERSRVHGRGKEGNTKTPRH